MRLFFDVEGAALLPSGDLMIERPTVVMVHGGPGADHSLFKPSVSPLTDVAQLVYVDLRGSGRSDHGEPTSWEWEEWAEDLVEFCEVLEIERPVLFGTSCGAWIALLCAINCPDRIRGLVLDSAMPGTHEDAVATLARTGGPEAAEIAMRYFTGDDSPELSKRWAEVCLPLYSRRSTLSPATLRRVRRNEEVETRFRTGRMRPFDPWSRAEAVTCPTLILSGADDPVTPMAEAERLRAALKNAPVDLEIYEQCGHGVVRELGPLALDDIRRFLSTI